MRRATGIAVVVLVALSAACGARTSLAPGGGAGGGDAASGAGGATTSAAVGGSGGGGGAICEGESFGVGQTAGAQHVAMDDTHVYWTTDGGEVVRARLGGGARESIAPEGASVGDLVIDGDRLVFSDGEEILAVPTFGGPVERVATSASGPVVSLAVDGDAIYAMAGGSGILAYTLERLGRDGSRTVLVSPIDFGRGIALQGEDVLFAATLLPGIDELGLIARVPRTGGPFTVLAASRPDPTNVFVRGEDVYWTEQFDALGGPVGVARLRPGDASPTLVLVAPTGSLPILSTASDRWIAMTALDGDRALLLAAPIDGGATEVEEEAPRLFLEPVGRGDRIAWSVHAAVDDRDDTTAVEVRIVCR